MGRGRPCIQFALIQALVTFGLLGFAYGVYVGGSTQLAAVIATAAATHWLKESAPLGQTVRMVGEHQAVETSAARQHDRQEEALASEYQRRVGA